MTDDLPFWRHMTSNKTRCFLNLSILHQLISKLVHTLIGPYFAPCKKCIDQNNITYVSMATKYAIIKHRAFFKTNNEDIGQKFLPDTYDHTLML